MEGLEPLDNERGLPDVFVRGQAMRLTQARAYFRLKNLQMWGVDIHLHPWDTWEHLADRLDARFGRHIWHLSHWDAYYATLPDVPASTPGAVPLTRAMARAQQQAEAAVQGSLWDVS